MNDVLPSASQMAANCEPAKVLLIMPPDIAPAYQPHLGLGILANRLKGYGHDVLALDYSYLASFSDAPPKIDDILADFDPDVIGVSLFSQHLHFSQRFIATLNQIRPTVPIVVGGPHVSLGSDNIVSEVLNWPGVRTVVRGEADADIVRIINDVLGDSCGL